MKYLVQISWLLLLISFECFSQKEGTIKVRKATDCNALPGPRLNIFSGDFTLPPAEMGEMVGLEAVADNGEMVKTYEVKEFTLVFAPKKGDLIAVSDKDCTFSVAMKRLIWRAEGGDKYYLEDIYVRNEQGQKFKVKDIVITIVDERSYRDSIIRVLYTD